MTTGIEAVEKSRLRGHAALVTGGAQGIGKGITLARASAGMRVVILDVNRRAGRETAEEIRDVTFVEGDASEERDVRAAVRVAQRTGRGLYAAVANAGVFTRGSVTRFSRKDWDRLMAVNLTAAFLLAKNSARALGSHRGSLVIVASIRAHQSEPSWDAYCASKGGLVGLTQALAVSLAPKVRVNCVSPGWVPTEQWQERARARPPKLSAADRKLQPIGRTGSPVDIGSLVRFLVSPEANFITGAEVVADGGLSRKLPAT